MPFGVTSWFVDQTQLRSSNPKRVFTLAGSDYSAWVTKWPTYRRSYDRVIPGTMTIGLANDDQTFNFFRTDKTTMRGAGVVQMGYTHATSGDELIDMFNGTISDISYADGGVSITMMDKAKVLGEIVLGSTETPLTFTSSQFLPSDIVWWIVTSYMDTENYSNITSTSNPDIAYADFSAWAAVFSGDSIFAKASFDGIKVNEALSKIARMTRTSIFVHENRLHFHRFSEADTPALTLDLSMHGDVDVHIKDKMTNKQHVYGDYDIASKTFALDIIEQSSASVSSFGLHEDFLKDESVWMIGSVSCLGQAQSMVALYETPKDELTINTTLPALPMHVGDGIHVYDPHLVVNSTDSWRVHGLTVNMQTGRSVVEASGYDQLQPFILDDDINGLLDQDYNVLT